MAESKSGSLKQKKEKHTATEAPMCKVCQQRHWGHEDHKWGKK